MPPWPCAHAADRDAIGRRFASVRAWRFRLVPKMMRFAKCKIRGQSTRPRYAVCRDWPSSAIFGRAKFAVRANHRRLSHRVTAAQTRVRAGVRPLRARKRARVLAALRRSAAHSRSLMQRIQATQREALDKRGCNGSRNHCDSREQKISREGKKTLASIGATRLCRARPISHVPVAACRLVGIRTRGRTAARSEEEIEAKGLQPRRRDHRPLELRTT